MTFMDVIAHPTIIFDLSTQSVGELHPDLIKLTTTRGIFVVKIFSKEKKLETIEDIISGFVNFYQSEIPFPQLLKNKDNEYLSTLSGKSQNVYLCVMKYFEGKSLKELGTTDKDISHITKYVAKIHQSTFTVHHNYDSWGTANLLAEYEIKKDYLSKEDNQLIISIIKKFKTIPFEKLPKGVIHGDIQKQHVLKNEKGEYCMLDLGCMDYNSLIIDLAIFITQFCFDLNLSKEENMKIYDFTLAEYQKYRLLSAEELKYLPLLLQASFAIYTIATSYLQVSEHDTTQQTKDWLQFGCTGLRMFAHEI